MSTPVWVLREVVLLLHAHSIAEHGGASGIRDESLLDSALARPLNLCAYAQPSLVELAASYAHGIVKNHPFVDGNKRAGFIVAVTFLELNGYRFQAEEYDAASQTLALAAGELSEGGFARWLALNSGPAPAR